LLPAFGVQTYAAKTRLKVKAAASTSRAWPDRYGAVFPDFQTNFGEVCIELGICFGLQPLLIMDHIMESLYRHFTTATFGSHSAGTHPIADASTADPWRPPRRISFGGSPANTVAETENGNILRLKTSRRSCDLISGIV
jgi:hypothetical protein